MEETALLVTVTLLAGVVARLIYLPPLVGFLAVGFILHGAGVHAPPDLETLANLGVTLLLFTIGLKFDIRALTHREIWGTASIHMAVITLIGTGVVGLLTLALASVVDGDWGTFALIGFALSFSSTVLCVKVLEERGETNSLYGQVSIGILLLQDLAAVVFMAVSSGTAPSPWSPLLVVVAAAVFFSRNLLERLGHGELLVLYGIVIALVPGWWTFEAVGLKGDLGALLMGLALAPHPKADELARILLGLKELLLVGFFVSIGFHGFPAPSDALIAVLLVVILIPVKTYAYAWLLYQLRLRGRTSVRSGLVLGNFSEFAIIVAAVGVSGGLLTEHWLVMISLAVAMGMVVSTMLTRRGSDIVDVIADRFFPIRPPEVILEHDRPIVLDGADAIVLGMGRIGRAAYDALDTAFDNVLGIDSNEERVTRLADAGYHVVEGDASDPEFWERVREEGGVKLVVLAMPAHGGNVYALKTLKKMGYNGKSAALSRMPEEFERLTKLGVDQVISLYEGAGERLAEVALLSFFDDDDGDHPVPDTDAPAAARAAPSTGGDRTVDAVPDGDVQDSGADDDRSKNPPPTDSDGAG